MKALENNYVFNVYPYYQRYRGWFSPVNSKEISDLVRKNTNFNRAVITPEFLEQLEKKKTNPNINYPSAFPNFLNILSGKTCSMVLEGFLNNYYNSIGSSVTESPFKKLPPTLRHGFKILAYDLKNQTTHWDENKVFRFYALNSFVAQSGYKTFGEFLENNISDLYEKFLIMEENLHDYTESIAKSCSNPASLLRFVGSSSYAPKTVEIFYSLTVKEVKELSRFGDKYNKTNLSKRNYRRVLESTLEILRAGEESFELHPIVYAEAANAHIEEKLNDLTGYMDTRTKNHLLRTKNDFTKLFIPETSDIETLTNFSKIYRNLIEVKDEVPFHVWFSFLITFHRNRFFFNRAGVLGYKIFADAMDKFGTVPFINFVEEIFNDHNDELPTASDWSKFLGETESLEGFSPTMVVVIMMEKNRNHVRGTTELIRFRRIVSKVREGEKKLIAEKERETK